MRNFKNNVIPATEQHHWCPQCSELCERPREDLGRGPIFRFPPSLCLFRHLRAGMTIPQIVLLLLVFLFFGVPRDSLAANPITFERANRLYDKEKYEEAGKKYEDLSQKSSEAKIHYNWGDSYYRQGRFDEARKQYEQALNSEDPNTIEKSLYNLGNTHYRMDKLQEAVDAYNKALEINPQNKKAELNRDFVMKKMQQEQNQKQDQDKKEQNKQEKDEQKQKSEDQKKDEQDQQNKNDQQQNQQQAEQDQQKGEQGQDKNREQKQDRSDSQNQDQQAPKTEEDQRTGQGRAEGQARDLSKKEAEQWLNSISDDPKNAIRDMILKDSGPRSKKTVEKDW